MTRAHFISGMFLTIFIGFHLFNHFMSLFGSEVHISVMNSLRLIYRNPVIEILLMLAVLLQIGSGIKLFSIRKPYASSFFDRLHLWSGMYLAIFLLIHVSAVLIGRSVLQLDTNIYFGAAGLNTFPINLFFIPYYSLAVLSFFGHVAAIHHKKMKRHFLCLSPAQQAWGILITGLVICVLLLFGLTAGFTGLEIPETYQLFP
ncbi:MAG: hypothetical protein AAFY71_04585 [Bacteroidota bacterium]